MQSGRRIVAWQIVLAARRYGFACRGLLDRRLPEAVSPRSLKDREPKDHEPKDHEQVFEIIRVSGSDALAFLQGQLTQDVERLGDTPSLLAADRKSVV